jgi:hypothetical protein
VSTTWSTNQPTNKTNHKTNQPTTRPTNQPQDQPTTRPTNQPTNQPIKVDVTYDGKQSNCQYQQYPSPTRRSYHGHWQDALSTPDHHNTTSQRIDQYRVWHTTQTSITNTTVLFWVIAIVTLSRGTCIAFKASLHLATFDASTRANGSASRIQVATMVARRPRLEQPSGMVSIGNTQRDTNVCLYVWV